MIPAWFHTNWLWFQIVIFLQEHLCTRTLGSFTHPDGVPWLDFLIVFYPFPSNTRDMTRTGFEEKQNHLHINNNNFQSFKELQNTWASEETFLLK